MSGIERITEQIIEEAKEYEESVMKEAREREEEILKKAREEAEKIRQGYSEKALKEAETVKQRAESANRLAKRNVILAARVEIIDEAFEMAKELLMELSISEYTEVMENLLREALKNQPPLSVEYELIMSEEEAGRIGEKLIKGVSSEIKRSGRKLKIELSEKDIGRGFILRAGYIEINCTIEKIIRGMRESMEREVNGVLFSESER